jgi:hypothetical protein
MVVVALACNLSSDNRPPTVMPRATNTPPPTLGYATLSPAELPPQATSMPQQPQIDTALLNLLNEVQMENLAQHVNTLQGFYTRHVNSPPSSSTGIGAAKDYILDQFNQIRDSSFQQSFVVFTHEFPVEWAGAETTGVNIVGYLAGTEPGGIILVGAHYDSISAADFEDGNAYAPGANDNASGVAGLMEIARVLSKTPHRRTIMFVAFGAEEVQRQGSTSFINDYLRPNNIAVDYMLNMDIIGSSTDANGATDPNEIRVFSAEPNNSTSRELARMINLIVSRHVPDMSVVLQPVADRQGRYGDHMSFNDANIAAVRFIEALENMGLHHTPQDVWDRMNPGYLTRATQTILACITALADGPRPPQNIQLRQNANGSRTLVWDISPEAVSYLVALRAPGSLAFNQTFPTSTNTSGEWGKFTPQFYEGVAVFAVDEGGLIGPVSFEYGINN